jgi:hypothetical protein
MFQNMEDQSDDENGEKNQKNKGNTAVPIKMAGFIPISNGIEDFGYAVHFKRIGKSEQRPDVIIEKVTDNNTYCLNNLWK